MVAPEVWGEAGAAYRVPVGDRSTFASAAFERPRGSGEFSDGRGHRVLAAMRRIPEIDWAVVVEVDRDAVLRGRHPQSLWIIAAAAALFAAITGAGLAWRRQVRLRHFEQLADRDRRYQTLLEQTQEAVAVAIDGKVAYANPACVEMFGYERPLIGVPVSIFFAPGSREQVEEIVQHRVAGRPAPELYEAVGLRADGATFDVEVRVTPIEFDRRAGSQAILRDITGRKRMEAGLRESEERYRLLFERNLAGVYRSTVDGRLLECNRAFARMMGYGSPAEAMAQPAGAFHGLPQARQEFLARLRREGSLVNTESEGRRKDGSSVWLIENVSLIVDEDGEEVLLGTVFDMTERRRLEEQLLQSQKMEAVGRLAGGIAHDFNNLLTAISGYSELLLEQIPAGDPRRESAEEIREAGRRAAGLTQQLLAFSRRQVLEPRVLDLNAVIAGMEKMLRRLIGEDIELTTALDSDLWRTLADPGQIEQVIVNLAVNARDAMPRGGRLTLETANVTLDEKFASAYVTVQPGPYVMLAVSRHRRGHGREPAGAALRALLHDQGAGQGDRARALHRVRNRQAERGLDLGLQRAGPRHDVQDLPAALRRAPRRARTAPARRRAAPRIGDDPPRRGRAGGPPPRREAAPDAGIHGPLRGQPGRGHRGGQGLAGEDRGPGDGRHHARHERAGARASPRRGAAGPARALHVGVHGRGHRAAGHPAARNRVPVEAFHAGRARAQGARGPGRTGGNLKIS